MPGDSDTGTGCGVLGVVLGVGPEGLGFGGGFLGCCLLVVTFNSPSFISRLTDRKQAA